jgi:hypothetical protein
LKLTAGRPQWGQTLGFQSIGMGSPPFGVITLNLRKE